jgi:GNAT superfamily N-acetyltransferase
VASVHGYAIERVSAADLDDLLPLLRAYCDFYEVAPADDALLDLARSLIADPEREGLQLLGRGPQREAVGFATLYWSWSTSEACRIGVMNDLFVAERARGQGLAEALIEACRSECTRQGARRLTWQTAPENLRAQAVYERVGGRREQWIDFWMPC